jgi:[amino group carrier protein]-lysine/ornithine hydrolase
MIDLWKSIKSKLYQADGQENNANSISCSLTEIIGGSSHNVTPQKCKITIDVRIPASTTCAEVLEILEQIISRVATQKGIKASYRIEDKTDPFEANHSSPLVRALSLSILDVRKKQPILLRKTGTGDMNILGNTLGIPVVTFGPGEPHASHTINERLNVEEYISSIEVFNRALFHLSRLHQNKMNTTKYKIL